MEEKSWCAGGRFRQEFDSFSSEVEDIFVDSTVAVINRIHELAEGGLEDLKGMIDRAAGKTKSVADAATEYVRANPWKAAAGFIIFSVIVGLLSRPEPKAQDEHLQ